MNSNKIGIWMDNSHAVFIDPYSIEPEFETLGSLSFASKRVAGEGSNKTSFQPYQGSNNEYGAHQKEIQEKHHYFKTLTDRLRNYDEIFLFGPSNASRFLFHELQEKKEFRSKKMTWEKTDKMTDNQMLARVKKYFFESKLK